MKTLFTLSGRGRFQYKKHPDGELIVYPADKNGVLQEKSAIIITPYTITLVVDAIKKHTEIPMGASRDNPPQESLGALIKKEKQSPQQLSYLIPILVELGMCKFRRDGRAFIVMDVQM